MGAPLTLPKLNRDRSLSAGHGRIAGAQPSISLGSGKYTFAGDVATRLFSSDFEVTTPISGMHAWFTVAVTSVAGRGKSRPESVQDAYRCPIFQSQIYRAGEHSIRAINTACSSSETVRPTVRTPDKLAVILLNSTITADIDGTKRTTASARQRRCIRRRTTISGDYS